MADEQKADESHTVRAAPPWIHILWEVACTSNRGADWGMDATVPGAREAGLLTSPTQGKSVEFVENPHSQQLKKVGFC